MVPIYVTMFDFEVILVNHHVFFLFSYTWSHYYRKTFVRRLKNGVGGGQIFEPSQLMHGINRGGHFLLTKIVINNRLAKSINEGGLKSINGGGPYKKPTSKNTPINRGEPLIRPASVNRGRAH
jgi:hypothetical protein